MLKVELYNPSSADNFIQVREPQALSIQQLFEEQAERTPDSVAVYFKEQRLSYRELNERANRLAHHLLSLGARLETLCAIHAERSAEMLVAILAVIKAGGAYLPLDPSYPKQRLSFMLADARPTFLLTEKKLSGTLTEHDARVIVLDEMDGRLADARSDNPPSGLTGENLLYVAYTSGSTGRPKGVQGLHKGAVNRFQWMWRAFPFETGEVLCQKTALSFVDSVWEIFGPLLKGVPLVIIPDEDVKDVRRLIETLARRKVTRIVLVPSLLRAMLDAEPELGRRLPQLKVCVSSGEALSPELCERFRKSAPETTLLNLYGSSEAAADATFCDTRELSANASSVPIGRPIDGARVYVLDERLQRVGAGEAGEIYVGGVCLARGYLERPELTAERFVPDPFDIHGGARLYRTGDLGRVLPSGDIEFLGRADSQVKIRGFRIELGEIESALSQHEAVGQSVALVCEDASGNKRLMAYWVSKDAGKTATAKELREFLAARLPDYMLPSGFVHLETMPLTPSRKVDRLSLAAHSPSPIHEPGEATESPRTQIESELKEIWEGVLGISPIGVRDNFFELGGDSLLAVSMLLEVHDSLGKNIPLSALIHEGTIEHLARVIESHVPEKRWSSLVEIQTEGERTPIFFMHPIGGEVFGYGTLARYLGSAHPFYGIQARGLDGLEEPFTDMRAMASHYVEIVRSVQPSGPYILGGYSLGAVIAFEMAQQLQESGEEIALLAVLDEEAPGSNEQGISAARLLHTALNLPYWLADHVFKRQPREVAADVKRHLKRVGRNLFSRIGPLHVEAHRENLEDMLDVALLPDNHRRVSEALFQALAGYEARRYEGRVTLFRTRAQPVFRALGRDKGWKELASGGVDVRIVPGNHLNMYDEPHVQVLAREVRACLEEIRI
ncbi:MAG TPA: amino acid adenylation domain-containing protein [Pyrinomonadaceae bacterium]|nr:amino acid adenylation domain-containing protein [Pyrinomonadaceae bacterium]